MDIGLKESNNGKQDKGYDLEGFRVLIVEDASFVANLLASCLLEMGVGSVVIAENVAAAKEKILENNAVSSEKNIDMILLDWLMPDGTGGDVLKWMRRHKNDIIRFIPVIVCSAYTSTKLVFESRDAGANEVVVKPISAGKISKRMLHLIDHPRPYIQSANFIGPDRRRKDLAFAGEDKRKEEAEIISE